MPADLAGTAVLFDLDDTLLPLHTIARWQWAWRPNGPVIPERHAAAAIRRSMKAWDRRRWRGLTGAEPPVGIADYWASLEATLRALADRPLPPEEVTAVIERFLRPIGPIESYLDVAPVLARLAERSVGIAVLTPMPTEVAEGFLKRAGLDPSSLVTLPEGSLPAPDRSAYRAGAAKLDRNPREVLFVGDLYWSDVRAAARAGLRSVLIDRDDRASQIGGSRLRTLAGLPGVLEGATTPLAGPDSSAEPSPPPP